MFGKPPDKISFFKPGKPLDAPKGPSRKRHSEDISPTRVGPGSTQGLGTGQNGTTREESGESSRQGDRGFMASAKKMRGRKRGPLIKWTKDTVSSFIKASQYNNVRMPSAEEFPSQPRGLHSYTPKVAPAAKSAQSRKMSVPATIGEGISSQLEREQRTSGQPQQMKTAYGLLSRVRSTATDRRAPEGLQAAPRPHERTASNENPTSEPDASLPCSSGSEDEEAIAAMSQSTILVKGKGKSIVANDSSIDDDPPSHDASVSGSKSTVEGGPIKIDKGKGKAVSFSKSNLKTAIAASAPRNLPRPAARSPTSRSLESKVTAVDDPKVQLSGAPSNATGAETESTASRASGKQGEGKYNAGTTNTTTST